MPTDITEQGLERLKDNLTKQTVDDAVRQYRKDRNPRAKLFEFGRCVAHFALDENEVRFYTHLTGADAWFLPFDRGWNDGAGNPPNPVWQPCGFGCSCQVHTAATKLLVSLMLMRRNRSVVPGRNSPWRLALVFTPRSCPQGSILTTSGSRRAADTGRPTTKGA